MNIRMDLNNVQSVDEALAQLDKVMAGYEAKAMAQIDAMAARHGATTDEWLAMALNQQDVMDEFRQEMIRRTKDFCAEAGIPDVGLH